MREEVRHDLGRHGSELVQLAHPDDASGPSDALLEVPSELPYLRTIRLTTASLLTGWEVDVELVEDLRVAVTEACTVLWKHHDRSGTTRVAYHLGAESIRVELQLRPGAGPAGSMHSTTSEAAVTDALGESLIEHLTDRHHYDAARRLFVLEADL